MALEGELMDEPEGTPPLVSTTDLMRIMIDELTKLRRNQISDTRMRATARAIEVICGIKKLELAAAIALKDGSAPNPLRLIDPPQ